MDTPPRLLFSSFLFSPTYHTYQPGQHKHTHTHTHTIYRRWCIRRPVPSIGLFSVNVLTWGFVPNCFFLSLSFFLVVRSVLSLSPIHKLSQISLSLRFIDGLSTSNLLTVRIRSVPPFPPSTSHLSLSFSLSPLFSPLFPHSLPFSLLLRCPNDGLFGRGRDRQSRLLHLYIVAPFEASTYLSRACCFRPQRGVLVSSLVHGLPRRLHHCVCPFL